MWGQPDVVALPAPRAESLTRATIAPIMWVQLEECPGGGIGIRGSLRGCVLTDVRVQVSPGALKTNGEHRARLETD